MAGFDELERLLETDPVGYREAIARMRVLEPARLEAFVDHMRAKIEASNEAEDRPATATELRDMIDHVATALGWSRARVMTEAMVRLRAIALSSDFKALTPPDQGPDRKAAYERRRSSIRAMVLGDYRSNTRAARMRSQELPVASTYRGTNRE